MRNLKSIILLSVLIVCPALQTMAEEVGIHRFANYNIRFVNASNGDTGQRLWANRRQYVVQIITDYDFDVVGMEEVTGNNKDATTGKSQLQDLRDMLAGYADYSVERTNSNYSYNSIFYKTSKYTLIDKGRFYINEHPETPGIGWEGSHARTCIWVHLRDNASQQDFYFACTHQNYGETMSGIEGAKLVGNRIRQLAGQTPVILVGDFNMVRSTHEEAYRGYASHLYDLALTAPVNRCLPADGPQITATTTEWTPATSSSSGNEFDYIFYDHMEPLSRHIITQYYPEAGRTVNPSDHYPVLGRFRLGSTAHATRFYATDVASLQTALADVTMEDTIMLAAGNYNLTSPIAPACSMVLMGGWNADFSSQTGVSTLVASALTEPVINIPHYYNLELNHICIQGGNVSTVGGGAAVYSYGPNLRLIDCRFFSNTASSGGAVVHKGDSLYIEDCLFSGNTATNGGALWFQVRDKALIHNSRFLSNTASAAGAAIEARAFNVLDVQRCSFVSNTSATHGALDIAPAKAPTGAHLLNCSFLDNTISAKKGIASATKKYGGAALWADMMASTVPLNIGLCTFMGNHIAFTGTEENFGGAAVAVFKAKMCLMDNLILANDQKIGDAAPVWADLYTVTSDVNLWRDTYNLYSSSTEINGWENTIVDAFGGTLTGEQYTPHIKTNGAYPIYQKTLASYNIMCLPTTQRLCESAFTYDLDGDGTVGGYIKYDQVNHSRGIKSCIGAVEYTGNDQPEGVEDVQMDLSAPNGAVYSVTGQYMGTDINVLPSGIYIVNGHKIIRQ